MYGHPLMVASHAAALKPRTPEDELREIWTQAGVPLERQEALLRQIAATTVRFG